MLQGSEGLHPFPCTVVYRMFVSHFLDSTPSGRPDALCQQLLGSVAEACPFCNAVSQTLRQEMGSMDAVVIARRFKMI